MKIFSNKYRKKTAKASVVVGSILFVGYIISNAIILFSTYSLVGSDKCNIGESRNCEVALTNLETFALIARYGLLLGAVLIVAGALLFFTNKEQD